MYCLLFFGDGFDVVPHPANSRYGYAMSQQGNVGRYDLATGHTQLIKPVHPEGKYLRFNWNAAIAQDPFDEDAIFYGSQFVHKSTNGGLTWQIISGDLTNGHTTDNRVDILAPLGTVRNVPAITKLMLNPVDPEVIWAATNDGNLFVSISGGGQWENKKSRVRGLPDFSVVSHIHSSTFSPASAIVAVSYTHLTLPTKA